ncbi:MAG: acetylxylan esterase [Thermoanaerobaculales bacterium]|nr:acetylxylan esterase [Thermoanaerobaculales bacterium]
MTASHPDRKRTRRRDAALAIGCLLIASCASRTHFPYDPGSATAFRPAGLEIDPPRQPVAITSRLVDTDRRYERHRLGFPSAGDNGQPDGMVAVDYHRSRLPGRHPVVVVLPIWGRHVYPSNAITRTLRKRSDGAVHVLNVLGPDLLVDWEGLAAAAAAGDPDAFLATLAEGVAHERTIITDVRRLVDWASARPEVDSSAIGVVGFSQSAIVAPVVAALDPRIGALVAVMGGAEPHLVLAHCEGGRVEEMRSRAAAAFGWDSEELAARLEPVFAPIDAARYSGLVDPERVLIIEAGADGCIPERSRDALWRAMGRPERWVIGTTHKMAFLAMTPVNGNWLQQRIWEFLAERLLAPEDAGAPHDLRAASTTAEGDRNRTRRGEAPRKD